MKKTIRIVCTVLALCLAISMPALAENAPLTIRASHASVNFTDGTFTLTYDSEVTETTLQFSDRDVAVFADPQHTVPLTVTNKKLKLHIEQGVSRLYLAYGKASYNVVLNAPRTPTVYGDETRLISWSRHYIQYLNQSGLGLMTGDDWHYFNAAQNLTRYETAAIAVRMLGMDPAPVEGDNPYADKLAGWAKSYVLALTRLGVLEGEQAEDGPHFNGARSITRSEVSKIIVGIRMMLDGETRSISKLAKESGVQQAFDKRGFDDVSDIPSWAKNWMIVAVGKYGLLEGAQENGGVWLYPTHNITRAEIAAMLARLNDFSEKGLLTAFLSNLRELNRTQQSANTQNGKLFTAAYEQALNTASRGTEKQCKAAYDTLRRAYLKVNGLIYLSPSRQMGNPYTGYATNEGAQMIAVGEIVSKNLTDQGYRVYMPDVEAELEERGAQANEMGAVCYVAIHSNAISGKNNGKHQGATVFHSNNEGSEELAEFVHYYLSVLTPTSDNGIKNDALTSLPYKEIRIPEMANVIAEVEYHDYAPYASWIINHKADIADAIVKGIEEYIDTL